MTENGAGACITDWATRRASRLAPTCRRRRPRALGRPPRRRRPVYGRRRPSGSPAVTLSPRPRRERCDRRRRSPIACRRVENSQVEPVGSPGRSRSFLIPTTSQIVADPLLAHRRHGAAVGRHGRGVHAARAGVLRRGDFPCGKAPGLEPAIAVGRDEDRAVVREPDGAHSFAVAGQDGTDVEFSTSQSRIVASLLADASVLPSPEKAIA